MRKRIAKPYLQLGQLCWPVCLKAAMRKRIAKPYLQLGPALLAQAAARQHSGFSASLTFQVPADRPVEFLD